MRESSKRPRVKSSSVAPTPPSSTSDTSVKASINPAVSPPSTLDDSDIRCMLETFMTVQAAHSQLLVDMLDEVRSLRADLGSFKRSPPPPPFNDDL